MNPRYDKYVTRQRDYLGAMLYLTHFPHMFVTALCLWLLGFVLRIFAIWAGRTAYRKMVGFVLSFLLIHPTHR